MQNMGYCRYRGLLLKTVINICHQHLLQPQDTNPCICFWFSATKPKRSVNSVTEDIDALLEELQEEDCSPFPQPKVRLTWTRSEFWKENCELQEVNYTLKFF